MLYIINAIEHLTLNMNYLIVVKKETSHRKSFSTKTSNLVLLLTFPKDLKDFQRHVMSIRLLYPVINGWFGGGGYYFSCLTFAALGEMSLPFRVLKTRLR